MPTEEELVAQAEKRREQGRRLQEIAAEKRKEKMESNERDLEELTALREERGELREKEWLGKLAKAGFDNEAELEDTIKKLDTWVKKARKKEAGEVTDDPMEEPSFPLVDVPDEELDEEGLKEKKKQRLLKSGWEFRVKTKREKEREREEREAEARREEEERNEDLEGWAKKLRGQQEKLMGKIKDRERRKNALGDRKSAAAQARMKV
jgi:actin-related protein 5